MNFAAGCVQAGANVAGIDIAESPHPDFHKLEKWGTKVKYYRYDFCLNPVVILRILLTKDHVTYRADVTDAELIENTVQQVAEDFGGINGW